MLLGHKHVGMCLWSVKSFLYHTGRKYSIVLHDDGSLTESDVETLEKHLVNVRIINKEFADAAVKEKISAFPNITEFRFSNEETINHRGQYNKYIMSLILLDINLLSSASKRMVMDADVLFFKTPHLLMDWIENPDDTRSLYSVEAFKPYRNSKSELCFTRRTQPGFNSGLLCLHEDVFDLAHLENWITTHKG